MVCYGGGSLFLEKHRYLVIKFCSTLQQAASYERWAKCVCLCVCVGGQRPFCSWLIVILVDYWVSSVRDMAYNSSSETRIHTHTPNAGPSFLYTLLKDSEWRNYFKKVFRAVHSEGVSVEYCHNTGVPYFEPPQICFILDLKSNTNVNLNTQEALESQEPDPLASQSSVLAMILLKDVWLLWPYSFSISASIQKIDGSHLEGRSFVTLTSYRPWQFSFFFPF